MRARFLRGLKDAKVLGCGKHFPGLGEANLDSHHDMPVVQKSWKKMWAEDLAAVSRTAHPDSFCDGGPRFVPGNHQ